MEFTCKDYGYKQCNLCSLLCFCEQTEKLKNVPTPREWTTDARLPLPADRLSAVG